MDVKTNFTKVVTNEKMLIDIPVPGLTSEDIRVKRVDLDEEVLVKIRSKVESGFGFMKKLVGYKDEKRFFVDSIRFDAERMSVELENGLLRVSIPKRPEAIGETVFPVESD